MFYRLAAELLVLVHFSFIVFVILGGLLVYKWHWMAWLHLPAAAWGAIVEYRGWICPLTPWENRLRELAGHEGYAEGFIEHYLLPLVYPSVLTRDVQLYLAVIVVAVNLVIYGVFIYRVLRQ